MLKDVLSVDLVTTNLQGRNKREIIQNLFDILCTSGKVRDTDKALKDLLDHEEGISTGMQNGIAIPHATSDAVEELVAAVGISKRKINFECLDNKPAQIFVMTLSPKDMSDPHVQFLAEIGCVLKEKKQRKALIKAKTEEELYAILTGDN